MNIYLKWICKLAMFFLLFAILDHTFGFVIYRIENKAAMLNPEADKIRYLLKDVTDEVLIVGASDVKFSYRPDILMDSLGLTVYNCGVDKQRMQYQTALLNSIMDRYSPKLIIWSVSPEHLASQDNDMEVLSAFKPYYRENKYFKRLLDNRSWGEKYKMISWLYTYNSVFTPDMVLSAVKKSNNDYHRGYNVIPNSKKAPKRKKKEWKDSPDEYYITLFEETLKKLHENKLQVIFVFSPRFNYGDYSNIKSYIIMRQMIEKYGYVLLEDFIYEPTLMHDYLFKDNAHLNNRGVEIYSKMFAKKIKSLGLGTL